MSEEGLYSLALCAAFWLALLGFRGDARAGGDAARFVVGLAFAGLLARSGGLLFAPAGLFLVAPLRREPRASFLDAALPALPLAFAVAKLGCIAASCCAAAGAEAVGFAAVGVVSRRSRAHAATLALAGIGLVRLLALPLRPEARGSALLAFVWLALAALRWRPEQRDERCPRPGNATSSRTPPSSRPGYAASSAAPVT